MEAGNQPQTSHRIEYFFSIFDKYFRVPNLFPIRNIDYFDQFTSFNLCHINVTTHKAATSMLEFTIALRIHNQDNYPTSQQKSTLPCQGSARESLIGNNHQRTTTQRYLVSL